MNKKINWLVSVLILLSMLLTACGGATPAPEVVEEEPEVVVEELADVPAEPEPTEVPPEPVEVDLDSVFDPFLGEMVAYNTIKSDALMESMVTDTPPFLLDVRSAEELEEHGHIEGAINIPVRDLVKHLDLLPDFDTPIVAYCGSSWRATIAMTALGSLGWTDVKALKVKFSDWKDAGNPVIEGAAPEAEVLNAAQPDAALVAEIDAMMTNIPDGYGVVTAEDFNLTLGDDPNIYVIDVRKASEVEEKGYIEAGNYVNVPIEELVANADMLPEEMDAPVVVYCGSGHRSTMAMAMLWAYDYSDVKSLKGGFGGWVTEGYALVGGVPAGPDLDGAFSAFLGSMEGYKTIKMDGLNEELAADEPPFVIDVRTPDEVESNGHIAGAIHIPLNELAQNLNLFPDFDTPIVTYCAGGWRATIAMTTLSGLGWTDVRALKNTFTEWVDAGYAVDEGFPPEAMVLDAATPDAELVGSFDAMLSNLPAGYGGITADDFFIELTENPDLVLIDARTPGELEEKGVIDAPDNPFVSVPIEEFVADTGLFPEAKDAPIVVYCGSGHRSTMGMAILWTYGYTNVQSLKGGFGGWVEAEYPVIEYAAQ